VLIPALPLLRAAYPGVRMSLVGDVIDNADYGTDPVISLRFDYQARRHESDTMLASFGYAIYGPAGARGDDLPWVSFHSGRLPTAPGKWLQERGVPLTAVTLYGNDADIVRNAIRAGIGKGLIPEILGEGDAALERLSGRKPEVVRHLRALTEHRNLALAEVRVVLEWLNDSLSRVAGRRKKA